MHTVRILQNKKFILVILVIVIGGFLRFYKLSDYPVQLNHDEVSQLYDTASIVQTGRDIYGNFLPLAFPSTGEFKVGHYIYISTLSYLIFGDQQFTIRVASAFFGTLTIGAVFLLVFRFTGNFLVAILSAFIMAIGPQDIFYSRKSFESVIGGFFALLGLWLLFKGLDEFRFRFRFLGLFFLTLSMYMYTSYTIIIPPIILLFILCFKEKIGIFSKNLVYLLIFWILLTIPLVYMTLTDEGLRFRAASVFITQDPDLGKQLEFSQFDAITFIDYVFTRYLNQFDISYLFGNGLNFTNQGLIGMGPLYFWQLPFLIAGLIFIIKKMDGRKAGFLLGVLALSFVPSALTFEQFSPHRAVFGFIIVGTVSATGLYWALRIKPVVGLIFVIIPLNFIFFTHMYTVNYPYEKSQDIHYPFKQIAQFAWQQHESFNQIIIDPTFGQSAPTFGVATHYYLGYYGNYPPKKFQEELKIIPEGLKFDKFIIRKVDWSKDQNLKNTLIIASSWQLPIKDIEKEKIMQVFSFYDGQEAFYALAL